MSTNRGKGGNRGRSGGPASGGKPGGAGKPAGKRGGAPRAAGRNTGPSPKSASARAAKKSTGRPSGNRRSPAAKRGLGGDQVEGRQAVRELLLAGTRRIREVMVIEDLAPADILDDINELALDMKVPLRPVTHRRFDGEALTESHQGVLARAQPLPEHELDDLAKVKNAFLLVLDGVTDPGNLGAILRTAECAGVTGVVLPRHRAVHISPTVTKTAAGAIEYVPMAIVGGVPAALSRLKDLNVFTVGLDMEGDTSMFELPISDGRPVALVLGAEGKGLSRLAKERVDALASIPMGGQLNSLNVAMAGAVACFEVRRSRDSRS